MTATFNLLRGQDLIWSYVVNNYLLGKEYTPFDPLYWNSDFTNLPARWHREYLADLYRDNKLMRGEISIAGTHIRLREVMTQSDVQTTQADNKAPARPVRKTTEAMKEQMRLSLAGWGHLGGVANNHN